jgi:hypothetical protein
MIICGNKYSYIGEYEKGQLWREDINSYFYYIFGGIIVDAYMKIGEGLIFDYCVGVGRENNLWIQRYSRGVFETNIFDLKVENLESLINKIKQLLVFI